MIEPRPARLVHAVPGRVRIRLDPRELTEEFGRELLTALTGLPDVQDVRITPRTGSVVITYDPASLDTPRLIDLTRRTSLLAVTPAARAEAARPPSLTAQRVIQTFGEVDARLAELSNGRWDLRSVVPFLFSSLALRQALRDFGSIGAAPWYVLAWYAFDSFWKLNERQRARATEPPPTDLILPPEEHRD